MDKTDERQEKANKMEQLMRTEVLVASLRAQDQEIWAEIQMRFAGAFQYDPTTTLEVVVEVSSTDKTRQIFTPDPTNPRLGEWRLSQETLQYWGLNVIIRKMTD